ncbi:MAG: Rid family hydrolase [Alphaproteobacteria bacterium]
MDFYRRDHIVAKAGVRAARFTGDGGAEEAHLCVTLDGGGDAAAQMADLTQAYRAALADIGLPEETAVFRRIFVSDFANQKKLLAQSELATGLGAPAAVSCVQQAPLPAGKFALWAYHLHDGQSLQKKKQAATVAVRRPERTHLWTTGLGRPAAEGLPSAFEQTEEIIRAYQKELGEFGADLADHAVRTWFFVYDIDNNYEEMVRARRERFAELGLTEQTHYIASTGIEGRPADAQQLVLCDAYAVEGLDAGQVRYLQAPDNLGPTSQYGVTFERGVSVDYGDRRQVFISGTASIDNQGRVMHEGDIQRQLERTFANVEALLADAEAGLSDLAQMIVYLRDPADQTVARDFLAQRCGDTPTMLVLAPVCRPSWLVEVEAIALLPRRDERWPAY